MENVFDNYILYDTFGVIDKVVIVLSNTIESNPDIYNSESVNVRMWAATYILPICECNAMQILQVIANGNNILLRLVAL